MNFDKLLGLQGSFKKQNWTRFNLLQVFPSISPFVVAVLLTPPVHVLGSYVVPIYPFPK